MATTQRLASTATLKWSALASHLSTVYHAPDLEALSIICAAVSAHAQLQSKPIWLIVVGPPSTGKTEICIDPFSFLPSHHMIGDLTPKSFLSARGGRSGSFLRDSGPSSIWLCKDLGTLLSKREHDAKEVFAILRDVYDGEVSRKAGGVKLPTWRGKVTFIAASTPFLDRAYDFISELGDRFVFVRWHRGDGIAQGRKIFRQIRNERVTQETTRALVKDFLDDAITSEPGDLPPSLEDSLLYLAEATARLRTRVVRERDTAKRDIIEIPEPEGPGRLLKTMTLLTSFHAALMGKEIADTTDLSLARRISHDSIPAARARFVQAMTPGVDNEWVTIRDLTSLPASSINWVATELEALGIIERYEGTTVTYNFTETFNSIWTCANPHLT